MMLRRKIDVLNAKIERLKRAAERVAPGPDALERRRRLEAERVRFEAELQQLRQAQAASGMMSMSFAELESRINELCLKLPALRREIDRAAWAHEPTQRRKLETEYRSGEQELRQLRTARA
jgi:hypothetical protein